MQKYAVALAYPAPKRVALSSLAFHMLAGYLSLSGVGVKKVFLEDGGLRVEPGSLDGDLRAVLFSLPYEIQYVDMVRMMMSMGLSPYSRARGDGDPIIIAGGPAVTANPLPVSRLVDAILVGEAEPVLDDLIDALSRPTRGSRLRALAEIKGVYVPGYSSLPVERVYVRDLDSAWYPVRQEMDEEPVWGRGFILETTRGCGRMCRFCMEGSIFRPKRDRSLSRMRELVDEGVAVNRVGRVVFYSLIFFDNPASDEILEYVVSRGFEASVPSLRAESLTEERARMIAEAGQKTITIAPETGSCVIAKAILKPIGSDVALWAVGNAVEAGIRSVKLYLMTGFPGEREEDVESTIELARSAARIARSRGARVRVSLNPFMPKPVTGMQWLGLEDLGLLRSRIGRFRRELGREGIEVSSYDPRWALVQVVLSRGDEDLGSLIVEWAASGGGLGGFRRAVKKTGVDVSWYYSRWPPNYDPPWHRVVAHPYAELWRLRRDYKAYVSAVETRGSTSRLRIRGCD